MRGRNGALGQLWDCAPLLVPLVVLVAVLMACAPDQTESGPRRDEHHLVLAGCHQVRETAPRNDETLAGVCTGPRGELIRGALTAKGEHRYSRLVPDPAVATPTVASSRYGYP